MKKNILKICMLVLGLFIALSITNVKAANEYEALTNNAGQTVKYRGSTKTIQIPTFYEEAETEFRGTWVSFYAGDVAAYVSKSQMMNQLNGILDTLEYYNMNSIVFHLRTHNDAYYPTKLAPMSSAVDNCKFEEWDYLEWFIEECHSRGIEFHAWLNPYRISSTQITEAEILSKFGNYKANPASNIDNVLISKTGAGAILNPAIPSVRDYIVDVCMELIENYDIDAIHFDDYFYIAGIDDTKQRNEYNTGKLSLGNFRRQQIDLFIEQLSNTMYEYNVENNRAVQLGVSPTAIYQNGSYIADTNYRYDSEGTLTYPLFSATAGNAHYDTSLYCDTKKWVDNDWLDYIIPQNYQSLDNDYASHAAVSDWWNAVVKNKDCKLYMGLGTYKMYDSSETGGWKYNADEMLKQLRYNQDKENIQGICIYQYKTIARNINDVTLSKIPTEYWTKPALNPIVTKYEDNYASSSTVENVKIYESSDAYALSWDKIDEVRRYAVYKTVNGNKELLGFVGNGSVDFVSFTDFEKQNGAVYSIVTISKANSLGDAIMIDTSKVSTLEYQIGKLELNVSKPEKLGATYMVIFDDPIIYFGDQGTYQIFIKEGSNGEWVEKVKAKQFNGANSNRLNYSEYGLKVYIKVVCTNNMGVFESEIIEITYQDTPNTILDYIFSKNTSFLDDLVGE